MAALADGIDYMAGFVGLTEKSSCNGKAERGSLTNGILASYVLLTFGWIVVLGKFSDRDFSVIVTGAAYSQLMGFMILAVKAYGTKSVAGLSSKTLVLYVLHYLTRLPATMLKSGYNPVDSTGDYMYQMVDFAGLLMVLHLLYCVHKTHVHSYQEEYDTMPLMPIVLPCVVAGYLFRAGFNRNAFFDSCFAISLNLETFVMLPQLWMLAKLGGKIDNMTCHYVMTTVAANVMTFVWWWYCASELEKRGPCLLAQIVVVEQVVKLLFASDFMFYYTKAWLSGSQVTLPVQESSEI